MVSLAFCLISVWETTVEKRSCQEELATITVPHSGWFVLIEVLCAFSLKKASYHYGLEQPKIQTAVLGHSLVRLLVGNGYFVCVSFPFSTIVENSVVCDWKAFFLSLPQVTSSALRRWALTRFTRTILWPSRMTKGKPSKKRSRKIKGERDRFVYGS